MIYPLFHLLPFQSSYLPYHPTLKLHLRLPSLLMLAIIVHWPSPRWVPSRHLTNILLSILCRTPSKRLPWLPFLLLRSRSHFGLRRYGAMRDPQVLIYLRLRCHSCSIPPMSRTTLLRSVRSAIATVLYLHTPSSSLRALPLAFKFS